MFSCTPKVTSVRYKQTKFFRFLADISGTVGAGRAREVSTCQSRRELYAGRKIGESAELKISKIEEKLKKCRSLRWKFEKFEGFLLGVAFFGPGVGALVSLPNIWGIKRRLTIRKL